MLSKLLLNEFMIAEISVVTHMQPFKILKILLY